LHLLLERARKKNQEFVKNTYEVIRECKNEAQKILEQYKSGDEDAPLELAIEKEKYASELLDKISDNFPENTEYVLSSPLGNIIAAAEQYPKKTFGMDSIVLWPFLRRILAEKNYAQFIIRERAIMDFMLNMTTILLLFGISYGLMDWFYNGVSLTWVINLSVIATGVCFLFFLSLQGALNWGATLSAAFIVFRKDLRNELNLRDIKNYDDEYKLWTSVSDFFRARWLNNKDRSKLGNNIFNKNT